jgi:hypothetical protein
MYLSLYGKQPPAYNRDFIIKRLAYRLQEIACGGLSERVLQRLDEVLVENGYDENAMPIGTSKRKSNAAKNHPVAGTVLMREWRGKRYVVTTLRDGLCETRLPEQSGVENIWVERQHTDMTWTTIISVWL